MENESHTKDEILFLEYNFNTLLKFLRVINIEQLLVYLL